jgi:hypothetical protein
MMQDVKDELLTLLNQCASRGDDLRRKSGLKESDSPISAIPMTYNATAVCLETTDAYIRTWREAALSKAWTPEEVARTRKQNGERIKLIQIYALISFLSSVEYVAKKTLHRYKGILQTDPATNPYWAKHIAKESRDLGLMDGPTYERWDEINKMRNVWVHNNGIADRASTLALPNGTTIEFKAGTMTQIPNLRSLIHVIQWGVDAYADWCEAFLTKASVIK